NNLYYSICSVHLALITPNTLKLITLTMKILKTVLSVTILNTLNSQKVRTMLLYIHNTLITTSFGRLWALIWRF
ncbi:hypothetical protein EV361DRAFT_931023, partial [Lentinula raphanica]